MKVEAVVVAAGAGKRLKTGKPKALVAVGTRPMIAWTLANLSRESRIKDIILVVPGRYEKHFRRIVSFYRLSKVRKIIAGGSTRFRSVGNALKHLKEETTHVLIHDGARPLINRSVISRALKAARTAKAVIAGVPIKPTVKEVRPRTMTVKRTVARENLFEVQTPQVFRKDVIVSAHKRCRMKDPSDDALLVEKTGTAVKVVKGDYSNIKVTTPEDIHLAEKLIGRKRG